MPRFTIITICYNAEDSIAKTVESVLQQTSENYEYIIVDGASTDDTLRILGKYKSPFINIYSECDQGISDAFNKGIAYSKGEYLLFLNSGDFFLRHDILKNVDEDLKSCSEEVVFYSVATLMNNIFPKDAEEGERLWEKSMIPHQGSFIRRDVFSKVGYFNTYYKVRMDYDFFSRCYVQGVTYRYRPRVIVYYDSNGISSRNEYSFHKEGLAVRLLYHNEIGEEGLKEWKYISERERMKDEKSRNELEVQKSLTDKHFKIMMVMNAWIYALQSGNHVTCYLDKSYDDKIAIYGWGFLGKCLENELRIAGIKIKYVIDQDKEKDSDIAIYDWNDNWPDVEMIVVTPFYAFQDIQKKIKKKIKCTVISIEEIIRLCQIGEENEKSNYLRKR